MAEGTGLIKRFYEDVIGNGNLALIDELTTDDIVDRGGASRAALRPKGVRFFVNAMQEAFPDVRPKSVEPMMADGNLEAARHRRWNPQRLMSCHDRQERRVRVHRHHPRRGRDC